MTPEGKQRAEQVLVGLRPTGCTNMWDGMLAALKIQAEEQRKAKAELPPATVLLLTDGDPSDAHHAFFYAE